MNKAIFLDRDGTINEFIYRPEEGITSPRKMKEFKILDGVEKAVKKMKEMGFNIIVVSNQPDIAKKLMEKPTLEKMGKFMRKKLAIDKFYYCPHHPKFSEECNCRKPKSGMLLRASEELGIDLERSYMIGDSGFDIVAGKVCKKTFLIKDGPFFDHISQEIKPDYLVSDLLEVVEIIKEIEREEG